MNIQLKKEDANIVKLKDDYLRQVGILSRTINYYNDLRNKKVNLQKGQYIFLTRVCENPGISLKDLTELLHVDKTTTTKAIQKLITIGYIEKSVNLEDKRILNLFPTKKALAVYNKLINDENEQLELCFEGFSEDEIRLAKELIYRMNKNINNKYEGKF